MLAPTYTKGELRLLEAADLVENSPTYDQEIYAHFCGTPACVLGHYAMAHPEDFVFVGQIPYLKNTKVRGGPLGGGEARYFGISTVDLRALFNRNGCGNAGTDGKKAAAFIRDFVARKVRERLTAAETAEA